MNVFDERILTGDNMAKKKTRKGKKSQQRQRQLKVTQKDVEQGKDAIKTMATGAVLLSLFMAFFALEISGETMYERVTSIFSAESSSTDSD